MTLGFHSFEDLAGREIARLARDKDGLSAARDWRAYSLWLHPYDTESHRKGYVLGYPKLTPPVPPQSSCTQALMAFARDARRVGAIDWEGQYRDVLRVPQASGLVGDSPALMRELGRQYGILREPGVERPDTHPGVAMLIGGDDGLPPAARVYGGMAHGLLVLDDLGDGTLETIEGGQGAGGTAVAIKRRELVKIGPHWWIKTPGVAGARRLRWSYQLGALPGMDD